MKTTFISLILSFFTLSSNLFSLPIDLSLIENKINIPVQIDQKNTDTLEFYNFNKNTTYIIHIDGAVKLSIQSIHLPVIVTENNSVLIENEGHLGEDDVLTVTLSQNTNFDPAESLQITKLAYRTDVYPNLGNARWGDFIDQVKDLTKPGAVTARLVEMTKDNPLKHVFTVGCESGKDPLYWVEHGADVTVLDGTPHAVAITSLRLADRGALEHLKDVLACMLEAIPDDVGLFDAVTGTAAFPFIPPHEFGDVMANRVLSHVAPSGYFAGQFFGIDHAWAQDPEMTFVSVEDLIDLFSRNGFEIMWLDETKNSAETVFDGTVTWHEIKIIAKKIK